MITLPQFRKMVPRTNRKAVCGLLRQGVPLFDAVFLSVAIPAMREYGEQS